MNHPFIKNKQVLKVYITIWILITGIHFVFFKLFFSDDWYLTALDSLVFNLIFAFIGFVLWYPLSFYKNKDTKSLNLIINHLSLLVFSGFIWLGASYNVLNLAAGHNFAYKTFLYDSLLFRGISGVFYYAITVLIYYLLNYYSTLQEKISSEAKLRELLKESELNFLKAQINPHFLFNSLNSISALTISAPEKAQEMVIKLSDFLRYVISQSENKPSTISNELENIKRYLEIEKIRFEKKLNFTFDIQEEALHVSLPILILQPLYENAIKHGVYESIEPITIKTQITLEYGFLKINIKNNYEKAIASFKGAGIGLMNIKERLRIIYQTPDLLKIIKTDTDFEVHLHIPLNNNKNEV